MTQEQVEHVARAFYEAEFPGPWDDARGAIQERFRDLARTAIVILNRQIAQCRRSVPKASAVSYSREIAWDRGGTGWSMVRFRPGSV
ncbi:hypothetical protein ACD578_28155 (plasmid) [Microvirga sp. RSM25]|uniref:hypothetical protein n=1 Tax=Microvirga sp. RSM25 TaxID=3273802 RepID=UPI00384B7D7D